MGRLARLARLVGALGGLAALAWAMRDRFISIAVPREPEPPAFRSQPSSPDEDLTRVKGIGPVFAERLKAAGITSFAKLAATPDETLAAIAEIAPARVETWRKQAEALSGA